MKYRDFRWPCEGAVLIHDGQEEWWAVLKNISSTGLCAFSNQGHFHRASRVRFSVLGHGVNARVVWVRSGLIGVKFDTPITGAELSLFRRTSLTPKAGCWPKTAGGPNGFRELR